MAKLKLVALDLKGGGLTIYLVNHLAWVTQMIEKPMPRTVIKLRIV